MPVNPGIAYQKAESEYQRAGTITEKLKTLKLMLATVPKHKGSEKLQQEIKTRIAKLNSLIEKEKARKKGKTLGIKKEGAASIAIVGATNSGKSSLLNKLTGANVLIADYPFTTKKPEVGMMDYHGIKIQIVEIPAIIEKFEETENGPTLLSIIRTMDLLILMFRNDNEKKLIEKELCDIKVPRIVGKLEPSKSEIWSALGLIKILTKVPGGKIKYPPVALKKGANVRELAKIIHKDFVKKFRYARVWGKSAKFPGQTAGLEHVLEDNDVVEVHIK